MSDKCCALLSPFLSVYAQDPSPSNGATHIQGLCPQLTHAQGCVSQVTPSPVKLTRRYVVRASPCLSSLCHYSLEGDTVVCVHLVYVGK